MRTFVLRLGLALAMGAIGVTLVARQDTAQQPTFVTGVDLVRVDLVASRDGQFVDDLRPEDIELYEDGTRQQIESFELVRIPPRGFAAATRASGEPDADARSRILVLFFDTLDADARFARERVIARAWPLFQQTLGPNDVVGLATREMDPASIDYRRGELVTRDVLDRLWERTADGRERDPKERLYEFCYPPGVPGSPLGEMVGRRREEMTFDALEALSAHLATRGDGRKVVFLITNGWSIYTRNDRMLSYRPPSIPLVFPPLGNPGRGGGVSVITESGVIDEAAMARILAECEADRFRLANLDHRNRLAEIADRANSGNVSFYPVSPGGVGALSLERQMDIRALADDTNGVATVNTNDIEGGIRRMLSDTSAYYLLGYVSSNAARDGQFRRITVRVTRPGVQVRARRGYRASRPEETLTAVPTAPVDPRAAAVAEAVETLSRATDEEPIRLRASAWVRPGAGPDPSGMFWIAGELDQRNDDVLERVSARISVQAPDGSPLTSSTLSRAGGSGAFTLRVPQTATPAAPGDYRFHVSFVDGASVVVASADGVVTLPSDSSSIGEPLLWRRGRGVASPYTITADPRYRRIEALRLEFPAIPGIVPTARVLDRTGAPLAIPAMVTTRAADSSELEWIVVDVTLTPFAAGEYAIELTSGNDRQVAAFAVVP